MKNQLSSISSGSKLLSFFKNYFSFVKDNRKKSSITISIGDALMSAYAMFSLKCPSALYFENEIHKTNQIHNLKKIFYIENVPSDTQMRDIVDDVSTNIFRGLYKQIFKKIQRDKKLEAFEYIRINNIPYYFLLADGTRFFNSDNIFCKSCNVKTKKVKDKSTGEVIKINTYHHDMLNVVITHPNIKTVIPLNPEPIVKQSGDSKYDCELKAFERFVKKFREDHPKLKVILLVDALYATGSFIKLLRRYDIKYIINVKPNKNKILFNVVNARERLKEVEHYTNEVIIGEKIKKNLTHSYRYINNVPIDNTSSLDFKVNFLEYWENINWINRKQEECEERKHFSWVTDISLNIENIQIIVKGGRTRWCIENEVFNTLKNHGYNYDRNFGHGNNNLSNNFAMLMMLAFFFDQILEMSSKQFKKLLKEYRIKSLVFSKLKHYYQDFQFDSWDSFIDTLIGLREGNIKVITINTS
jgi:hypothetical protein